MFARIFLAVLSVVVAVPALASSGSAELPAIRPNENLTAAGALADGTVAVSLRAAEGLWRPEGDAGPSLRVEAFGEDGGALVVPSPMIRVRAGVAIAVSIRNDLDAALTVHGLCARPIEKCAPVIVPPAERRTATFTVDAPGTYHYWATTTGMPLMFRGAPDTQLSGALIVDPAHGAVASDRVLVITDWTSLTRDQLKGIAAADDPGTAFETLDPRFTFLVNGLSWPATERLTYRVGESVRWRIVNLSSQRHPMHMHGFYYDVDSLGDGVRETAYAADQKPRVVTQLLQPGATMAMTWVPERPGNWLFHCHVMHHVSPDRKLDAAPASHAGHHDPGDAGKGMAGLVIGVTVLGGQGASETTSTAIPPRKLTMTMERVANQMIGPFPAAGFRVDETGVEPAVDGPSAPGPTLVLRRGEPVEVTLVNRLPEATAIHWHGIELDSYYDGVHGWSGAGARVTPIIEPGTSFVVRFTPPRTGTFIYHTHLHDHRQLPSGLYGALLVVEPGASGETFDPATDHVVVIGSVGREPHATAAVNGERAPKFVWKAGTRHRVRLINITTDDIFVVTLQSADGPVTWRPLTKDGAPLPPSRCVPGPARQTIAVGETYDFEVQTPPGRGNLWLEVRTPGGKWEVQGQVIVK
jgi:manganese oxidase